MFRQLRNIILPKLNKINYSTKSKDMFNLYSFKINNIKENHLVIFNYEGIKNIIDDISKVDVIYLYNNIDNDDYEIGYKFQKYLLNKPNSRIYVDCKIYDTFIKFIENSTKYKIGVSFDNKEQIVKMKKEYNLI
jgi:hypothetical protein